jgi:hypothetical protein
MNTVVTFPQLCEITGYERSGDVERCLRAQGIRMFKGKGGVPWTTIDLINAAGGLLHNASANEPYPSDISR